MVCIFVKIKVKYRSNQNILQIKALFNENSSNKVFYFYQSLQLQWGSRQFQDCCSAYDSAQNFTPTTDLPEIWMSSKGNRARIWKDTKGQILQMLSLILYCCPHQMMGKAKYLTGTIYVSIAVDVMEVNAVVPVPIPLLSIKSRNRFKNKGQIYDYIF